MVEKSDSSSTGPEVGRFTALPASWPPKLPQQENASGRPLTGPGHQLLGTLHSHVPYQAPLRLESGKPGEAGEKGKKKWCSNTARAPGRHGQPVCLRSVVHLTAAPPSALGRSATMVRIRYSKRSQVRNDYLKVPGSQLLGSWHN